AGWQRRWVCRARSWASIHQPSRAIAPRELQSTGFPAASCRSSEHPLVRGVIVDDPGAPRPRHYIQIVEIVAMRGADRMIAARHQHDVAIVHAHGLVEIAVIRVHALEGEALGGIEPMVVGLLEGGFFSGPRD